jgi:hypothetical protein
MWAGKSHRLPVRLANQGPPPGDAGDADHEGDDEWEPDELAPDDLERLGRSWEWMDADEDDEPEPQPGDFWLDPDSDE